MKREKLNEYVGKHVRVTLNAEFDGRIYEGELVNNFSGFEQNKSKGLKDDKWYHMRGDHRNFRSSHVYKVEILTDVIYNEDNEVVSLSTREGKVLFLQRIEEWISTLLGRNILEAVVNDIAWVTTGFDEKGDIKLLRKEKLFDGTNLYFKAFESSEFRIQIAMEPMDSEKTYIRISMGDEHVNMSRIECDYLDLHEKLWGDK